MAIDRLTPAGRLIEASLSSGKNHDTLQAVAELGWGLDLLHDCANATDFLPSDRARLARFSTDLSIDAVARLVQLRIHH